MRLEAIAEAVGGELIGDGSVEITGITGIDEAGPGDITMALDSKRLEIFNERRASAVIIPKKIISSCISAGLAVDNPRLAFAKALRLFSTNKLPKRGIHPTAILGDRVQIGSNVSIGAYCVIDDEVNIGDEVTLYPGCYIGYGVVIGPGTVIHANVVIENNTEIGQNTIIHAGSVIGADGFGYVQHDGVNEKVPQIGRVIIGDDVEIGANSCVDRATTSSTVIGNGVKLDNLVQVAHNAKVGDNTVIAALSGIAGSTKIGKGVMAGGMVGIIDHLNIGDNAVIAGLSGVIGDVEPGSFVSGYNARPHIENLKIMAASRRLPEALKLIDKLVKRVEELEKRLG